MSTHSKEPRVRLVKRGGNIVARNITVRLLAIVLSLLVSGIVIFAITGLNPLAVYAGLWDGAVGTSRRFWITLRDAAILLCIGYAVMPAFRMRFWNVGAEGQVLMGAAACAACMIYGREWPSWLLYAACPIAGMLVGMLWAVIPAFFKAHWNTNETLFTLMMNYLATQVVSFCIIYWENPKGSNHVGLINSTGKVGWLPGVFGNNYLLPILIVVVLMEVLYVYMHYSKQGFEISVVGESESTAHYVGINVKRVIIRTMAICGLFAGLAGYLLCAGIGHTISTTLVGGNGFTAIIVAWLGKLNPYAMLAVAFLLTFMGNGANQIASQFGLNENASDIITGIILFFILGCELFIRYKFEFTGRHKEKEAVKC